jgi:hypothetical protein
MKQNFVLVHFLGVPLRGRIIFKLFKIAGSALKKNSPCPLAAGPKVFDGTAQRSMKEVAPSAADKVAFTKCFHNSSTIIPSTILLSSQSEFTKFF